ncbi:MAG: hypothetical protein E6J43_13440 [Chloroflexi bacterium]|nr:MAG: hypothetical protein E6J43_13440 [Chloroflexota bacterium]
MTVESIFQQGAIGHGRDIITHEPSDGQYVVAWYRDSQPLVGEPVATIRYRGQPSLVRQMTQIHASVRASIRQRENLKQQLREAAAASGGGAGVRLESFRQWVKDHLLSVTQVVFLKGGAVVVDYIARYPKAPFPFPSTGRRMPKLHEIPVQITA